MRVERWQGRPCCCWVCVSSGDRCRRREAIARGSAPRIEAPRDVGRLDGVLSVGGLASAGSFVEAVDSRETVESRDMPGSCLLPDMDPASDALSSSLRLYAAEPMPRSAVWRKYAGSFAPSEAAICAREVGRSGEEGWRRRARQACRSSRRPTWAGGCYQTVGAASTRGCRSGPALRHSSPASWARCRLRRAWGRWSIAAATPRARRLRAAAEGSWRAWGCWRPVAAPAAACARKSGAATAALSVCRARWSALVLF